MNKYKALYYKYKACADKWKQQCNELIFVVRELTKALEKEKKARKAAEKALAEQKVRHKPEKPDDHPRPAWTALTLYNHKMKGKKNVPSFRDMTPKQRKPYCIAANKDRWERFEPEMEEWAETPSGKAYLEAVAKWKAYKKSKKL